MTYPLWYKGALMYIDRIDLSLPQEDFQSVLEAFASAAATLQQLPSVSPSDRKHYAKMGLKNEALTLQIIEVGRTHRHLIPAGMDFEKIDRDLAAREQLRVLKILLQNLLDRVSDSMLLTGVDLYAAALSMYHCLRRNADTAGLKSTVAELKKGFARPSRKKKEQQKEVQTASVPIPAPTPVSASAPVPEPPVQAPHPQPVAPERTPVCATPTAPAPEQHTPLLSFAHKPQIYGGIFPLQRCGYEQPTFSGEARTPVTIYASFHPVGGYLLGSMTMVS